MRVAPVVLLAATLLVGCRADLQHDLSEAEANEILVLLADDGVAGSKVSDGRSGGWTVRVPTADATRAWQILAAHGLPRRPVEGFAETFGDPGLIPSPTEDRARSVRATAGELERTIMAMNGVLDARVHLVQPEAPRWGSEPPTGRAQAAVLVVYRPAEGGASPVDSDAVRRLVSGAVAHLAADDIEVVTAARSGLGALPDETLSQLGPFTVGRSSHGPLQWTLAVAGALVVGLSALLVVVLWRARRARSADA